MRKILFFIEKISENICRFKKSAYLCTRFETQTKQNIDIMVR